MQKTEAVDEAARMLTLCNACRYCEGYCAVFPAIEFQPAFTPDRIAYLANLCHDCRGCYFACPYAPPHEFQLNLPRVLARVRRQSYAEYAWPRPLAAAFERNGTFVAVLTALTLALALVLAMKPGFPALWSHPHRGPGAFYAVIPEAALVALAGTASAFALLAFAIGAARFWRGAGAAGRERPVRVWPAALRDILTLRYLGGSGHGCNDVDDAFSQRRRYFHHALFYGFLLTFASTCTAAIDEHVRARLPPYPFFSAPVVLGTLGGIGILLGCSGLAVLKRLRDQRPVDPSLLGADYALLVLLGGAAATGLLLLALRDAAVMPILLALHFGFVLALLLTLPYGKFVHSVYRAGALLRHAAERVEASRKCRE